MPKLCKTRFRLPSETIEPPPSFPPTATVWRWLMRRSALALFASLPLLLPAALPDSKIEVKDLQNHPFAVDFPSGGNLRLHLRCGEFQIVGRNDNRIAVHLNGRNADNARDLTVRFRRSDNDGDLRVFGGPKNNLEVTIEIPNSAMLLVRMPAGDLAIEGVSGDKDVQLHFVDLTIARRHAADRSHGDASVMSRALMTSPCREFDFGLS